MRRCASAVPCFASAAARCVFLSTARNYTADPLVRREGECTSRDVLQLGFCLSADWLLSPVLDTPPSSTASHPRVRAQPAAAVHHTLSFVHALCAPSLGGVARRGKQSHAEQCVLTVAG